ncbi:MAG: hypothetical protein IMY71_14770 [Bacteroidetes bacterium]|nr:hypothetical protein [Bacteroidota bacterium]
MKKRSLPVIALFFLIISPCVVAQKMDIQVGTKATEWEFMDADKNPFTMDTWKGKVLQINYVDPDESDLNDEFNDLVKKAIDVDSIISRDHFKGFGIVDCASSWKPNFLIRAVAGKKAKKYETTILFDYDAILCEQWNLARDSYNVIILDKNRMCRAVYRGKIADSEHQEIIDLIVKLTKE